MKKLGKLSINPEKVIKNEVLINLKGGTYEGVCDGYLTCGPGKVLLFCACLSSIGAWCGCYSSEGWADDYAGLDWCRTGQAECYTV